MGEPWFHYRSDIATPRRVQVPTQTAMFVSLPSETAPNLQSKTTEIGVIGNTYLSTAQSSGYYKFARFIGYGNLPDMKNGISVVVRVIPRFSGAAPINQGGFFAFTGAIGSPWFGLFQTDAGVMYTIATGPTFAGQTQANSITPIAFSFVNGTAVDLVVTWDGTTSTNGCKIWINGNVVAQGTASSNSEFNVNKGSLYESICVPSGWPQGMGNKCDLNEFAVYDYVIDPVALGLTGPSRTNWLASTPSTALASLPTEAQVKSGVTFGNDNSLTGTLVLPTASQVKDAVVYGEGGNSLTGNVTVPLAADVEAGVTYGANGTEFTGTLDTGSTDPGVNNVLQGVNYEILGTPLTGTYKPVSANNVKINITFGPNASLTGTYNPLSNTVGYYRRPNPSSEFFAPIETQKALYQYLSNDEQLNELLGGGSSQKIFDHVPDNVPYPYVTFLALPFTPRDNHTYDGLECEYQVNVHYQPGTSKTSARGNLPVQLVQFRIDQLLHNVELCIEGWNTLQCRRTFITIETEDDNVTKQGIQRFKLYLGSKF